MTGSDGVSPGVIDYVLRFAGPVAGAAVGLVGGYFVWQRRSLERERAVEKSASYSALSAPLMVNLGPLERARRPKVRRPYVSGLKCMSAGTWPIAQGHFAEALNHATGAQRSALRILVGVCCYRSGLHVQAFQQFMTALTDAKACPDAEGQKCAQANLDTTVKELPQIRRGVKSSGFEFLYKEA